MNKFNQAKISISNQSIENKLVFKVNLKNSSGNK